MSSVGLPGGSDGAVPDWVILAIACVAQFMVVLDVTVVTVALPSIGRDLHYSASGLQWVVNAYVLTFAGFFLLGGRAADVFGRRRAYLAGLGLFSLASLAGGLATTSAWLTAARAAQGVGGAVLSTATLTIIVTTFTDERRARALGVWSSVAGAGGAGGSILGGVLTSGLSWRAVLFISVPIGLAAGGAAFAWLGQPARAAASIQKRPRLDVAGAVTVTAGLGALIYAVVGTSTHPWGSTRTLALLGVAVVLLAAFALFELRLARSPLLRFGLFRSRSVSAANGVMLLIGAILFSMWYFLSLYLQNVLGYGPLKTGLAFVPMGVAIIIGAQTSGRLIPRTGVRPVLTAGTLLATGGFAWLSTIAPHVSYSLHVFGPGCVIALALGLLFTPLAAAATAGVAPREAGMASGVLNTSRQVGGSLGLAVLATIASSRFHAATHHGLSMPTALADGYSRAFEVAAGLALAAFVTSLVVPTHPATTAPSIGSKPRESPVTSPDRGERT
ncbi:MAG: MFS transporter [Acidimicrobiales bacterium]